MAVQIQMRRDTASNWETNDPTLAAGEWGLETDTLKFKIGTGSATWDNLAYSSLPSNVLALTGGTMTGAIATNSTFDGVDVGARDIILSSTTVTAGAALPATGGTLAGVTLSGAVVGADQIISAPIMKDYAETVHAGGNSGTSQTLALTNGNVQTWTMTGNCTFTMPSGSTLQAGSSLTLILTQDGTGSRTGAYTGVKWAGGTVPTLTITATTGIDILTFTTFNGGASPVWHGFAAGLAMA
jgi:hypothetical protein